MKQSRSPLRRFAATAAFSLVELLMVVMIIGILLGVVVPAVNGIGRSSSLTTGGNTVVNMVNLARQQALTKNTMAALIVLGSQGVDEDYRALTILEFDPQAGWSQTVPWEILPVGVVVDANDQTNCSFLTHSPQPFPFLSRFGGDPTKLPVKFRGDDVKNYTARIFLPNGALQNPEQPAQLRMVEGFVQGTRVIYTNHSSQSQAANYYDVAILGMTGMPKVNRP